MSFRLRLILLVTGLIATVAVVTTAALAWSTRHALVAQAEANGHLAAAMLAGSTTETGTDNPHALRRATDWLLAIPEVEGVLVTAVDGRALFRAGTISEELSAERLDAALAGGGTLSLGGWETPLVVAPVTDAGGAPAGAVVVALAPGRLHGVIRDQVEVAAVTAVIAAMLGLVLAVLLARFVTEPLEHIGQAVSAVEARAFDPHVLRTVVARRDELGALARVFGAMAQEVVNREAEMEALVRKRTLELETKNRALTAAKHQLDAELNMAQAMQQATLPATFPQHEAYAGYANMTPAREVGGDFYDALLLDEERIGIAVADVSGKGVPAAFFMLVSRAVLRRIANSGQPPGACLTEANAALVRDNPLDLFVSVCYGILDARTGEFRYAAGGHHPPLLIRADGDVVSLPGTGGVVLGVMDDLAYEEHTVHLRRGDTLFLFTDGVTEAFDIDGEAFGDRRLTKCLQNTQLLSVQAQAVKVLDAVDKFAAGAPQSDDITCLVLRYNGIAETMEEGNRLAMVLTNDLSEIRRAALVVEAFGRRRNLPRKVVFDLNLSLDELVTNTCSYGWDDDAGHEIRISVAVGEDAVTAEIVDDAKPFNPLTTATPDTTLDLDDRPIGGLGVHLVRTLMDEVRYDRVDGHNHVVLVKRLDKRPTF